MRKRVASFLVVIMLLNSFIGIGDFSFAEENVNPYVQFVGDGYALSLDGNVVAKFNDDKSQLIISGHSLIDRNLWRKLSQADAHYEDDGTHYDDGINWNNAFGHQIADNFDIVFQADNIGKISLPEDSSFLFSEFDSQIYFGENQVDTSKVTNMEGMFGYAQTFNQPLDFDTSNVTNMAMMFRSTDTFNQPLDFNTANVTNMAMMFWGARSFNQPLDFNTTNVTNMQRMFGYTDFFNQPLNFNTTDVTNMRRMFFHAKSFNQPLNFNTSNVTDMESMFCEAINFNQSLNFNTSSVTDMRGIFLSSKIRSFEINFNPAYNNMIYGVDSYSFDTNKSLEKLHISHLYSCDIPAYSFKGDYKVVNLTDHSDDAVMKQNQSFYCKVNNEYLITLANNTNTDTNTDNAIDTDGDGLLDDWEINGMDTDGDGTIDLRLDLMGADPNKPDVFVEVDWMVKPKIEVLSFELKPEISYKPSENSMYMVYEQFKNHGINLHIDAGPDSTDFVTGKKWGDLSGGNEVEYTKILKTENEEGDIIWDNGYWPKKTKKYFTKNRQRVFHHCLFVDGVNTVCGGLSYDIPSQYFVIPMVSVLRASNVEYETAITFMHELGHNLGLGHGGMNGELYKPNYLSIMNYLFCHSGLGGTYEINYSDFDLPTLNENTLDERKGIDPDGLTVGKGLKTRVNRKILGFNHTDIYNSYGPINFNNNFNFNNGIDDKPVKADINNNGYSDDTLKTWNDWEHLIYNGGDIGKFSNNTSALQGTSNMESINEPSFEELLKLDLVAGESKGTLRWNMPYTLIKGQSGQKAYLKVSNLTHQEQTFNLKVDSTILENNINAPITVAPSGDTLSYIELALPIKADADVGAYQLSASMESPTSKKVETNITVNVAEIDDNDKAEFIAGIKKLAAEDELSPKVSNDYINVLSDKAQYNVSVTTQGGIGVVYGTGQYFDGDEVELVAQPSADYVFDAWYQNDKKIANAKANYKFTITADTNLVAKFKPLSEVTYQVEFIDIGNKTLKVDTVTHGAIAIAPQVPKHKGYQFVKWSESLENIIHNLTVYALYEKVNVDDKDKDKDTDKDKDKDKDKEPDVVIPDPKPPVESTTEQEKETTTTEEETTTTKVETTTESSTEEMTTTESETETTIADIDDNDYSNDDNDDDDDDSDDDTAVTKAKKQTVAKQSLYSDVDVNDYYYPAIERLSNANILNGTGDGKFSPNQVVNRAMLVTVLYRVSGEPVVKVLSSFADVEQGTWYSKAVAWAKANHIVNGYNDKQFAPLDTLMREQIITVLYRYSKAKATADEFAKLNRYGDVNQIADYAKEPFAWALAKGIVKPNDKQLLDPKAEITRAELAVMVDKIMK